MPHYFTAARADRPVYEHAYECFRAVQAEQRVSGQEAAFGLLLPRFY